MTMRYGSDTAALESCLSRRRQTKLIAIDGNVLRSWVISEVVEIDTVVHTALSEGTVRPDCVEGRVCVNLDPQVEWHRGRRQMVFSQTCSSAAHHTV